MTESNVAADERTLCAHCGEHVPPGAFCGHCAAHLAAGEPEHRRRGWSYAASPHEHVLQVAFVSTLFPHLPHRHSHAFRRALSAGVAIFLLLTAFHLYAAATVAAAFVLPTVYLLYLFEVEVFEHEPILVLAATFVVGLILSVVASPVVNAIADASGTSLTSPASLVSAKGLLLAGVALPLLVQVLMLVGPAVLLGRSHFNEALDGLAFGATSALGFSLGRMLIGFWPALTNPQGLHAPLLDWADQLVRSGLFVFTVNAGATAAITTSLWLIRNGRNRNRHAAWWRSFPAIVGLALAAQVALGISGVLIRDLFALTVAGGLAAALMLVLLRVVVHHALLEEGGPLHIGEMAMCPECHHVVPTMLFCPNCGVARSAAPKQTPRSRGDVAAAAEATS